MDRNTFFNNLVKVKDSITPELFTFLQTAPVDEVEETLIDILENGEYNQSIDWLISTFHTTTHTIGE